MSKPTVLLDMDGVLVESNWENIERLNERFGTDYKFNQIKTFGYEFLTDEQREFIYEECWHDPTLYDDKQLSSEWLTALMELGTFANIIVCSSPLAGHIESKYRFLTNYFDRSQIVLTADKTVIESDVLIDDGPHNITAFPGRAIVYDRPWNRSLKDEYPRVGNPIDAVKVTRNITGENHE